MISNSSGWTVPPSAARASITSLGVPRDPAQMTSDLTPTKVIRTGVRPGSPAGHARLSGHLVGFHVCHRQRRLGFLHRHRRSCR